MPPPTTKPRAEKATAERPSTTYTDKGEGAVSGNLTREPELRFTPGGRAVCTLRVAESIRTYDEDSDTWTDGPVSYWDVLCWGKMGENAVESLARGDRIAAVGRWQEQAWTSTEGQAKTKMVLVARDMGPSVLFLPAKVTRSKRERPGQG